MQDLPVHDHHSNEKLRRIFWAFPGKTRAAEVEEGLSLADAG